MAIPLTTAGLQGLAMSKDSPTKKRGGEARSAGCPSDAL